MADQSSIQLHSLDQSTTWRGIGGAVVRDALATILSTRSTTIPSGLRTRAKGPHQSGDPRGQCPVRTRQVFKRAPTQEPRKGNKTQKTLPLLLSSCCLRAVPCVSFLCPCVVRSRLCLCCRAFCVCFSSHCFTAPTQEPSLESGTHQRPSS